MHWLMGEGKGDGNGLSCEGLSVFGEAWGGERGGSREGRGCGEGTLRMRWLGGRVD